MMGLSPWLFWLVSLGADAITVLLAAVGVFFLRHGFRTWIVSGIQHDFNVELEQVRSDLNASLERLRSELRSRESELWALRDTVLSGRANRQALVDQRRVDAVAKVWAGLNFYSQYRSLTAQVGLVSFKTLAEGASKNPKFRAWFANTNSNFADLNKTPDPARDERPFVSPVAWAYYSAYQTVILSAWSVSKAIELGIPNIIESLDFSPVKGVLKQALPHRAEYLDRTEFRACFNLLPELQEKLLEELKKTLDGVEVDTEEVQKAATINAAASEAAAKNAEQFAKLREKGA